jgi:hypothetical protein
MKLTAKDIIKMLPYRKEFKEDLLNTFDTLTPDQKFNIVQIVWDTYNALYQLKLEENTEIAMMEVADGKEGLDKDFYKRIKDKTAQDMKKEYTEVAATSDLSSAREELEKILKQSK